MLEYAQYFQGNRILPIPELIKEVETKTLSFIIMDIKTRRLAGIRKETFEELLRAAGIPAKYFCRRSFATWDVLLPSEELVVKLAGNNVTSEHFRLQPEYMGYIRIKVTVCNVPIQLSGDVIAAYLTEYGDVQDVAKAKSTNGTAHGDHYFTMCLNRTGFQSIPHTIEYENQTMMMVVEGKKKKQCWNCKQLGYFSRTCPQKTTKPISSTSTTAITFSLEEDPKIENKDNPYKEEGWTQVIRGGKNKSAVKTQNPKPTQPTATIATIVTTTATKEKSSAAATTIQQQKRKSTTGKYGHSI